MNSNKTVNEITKTRIIRCNEQNETTKPRTIKYHDQTKLTMKPLNLEQSDATKQQQNGMKPLKLEQSDKTNINKTENETTKTTTIRYNEQQQN